jgi:glucose/arabinose dehydrogenase
MPAGIASAGQLSVTLVPVVTRGLEEPLYLTHAGDGSGRLFVVQQAGRIRIIEQGRLAEAPFLDVTDHLLSGGERGLLGMAFHPHYRENGRFFISYTRKPDGATVVSEVHREDLRNGRAPEMIIMVVPQPFANHDGGMIGFGPDGLLYIGRGDGGSSGDPNNRGQNKHDLLGKILRIDVDRGLPYAVPPDNPFTAGGGRPEVYAYGLRNPWRFSFDRQTQQLWVADVGQYKWEEIDLVEPGGNYGWRIMEGLHCFNPPHLCDQKSLRLPVLEYGHDGGRCSITGGYVYRGTRSPALRGTYLFGDYCSGELFGINASVAEASSPVTTAPVLLRTKLLISSFGEDESGEVFVVDHRGGIYRVEATEAPVATGGEGKGSTKSSP